MTLDGKNPVSKRQIQPEYGEWRGTGRPNPSRLTKFSGANGDREIIIFPVQLTTSRIDSLTRLIFLLLYVMAIHKYIYPRPRWPTNSLARIGEKNKTKPENPARQPARQTPCPLFFIWMRGPRQLNGTAAKQSHTTEGLQKGFDSPNASRAPRRVSPSFNYNTTVR